MPDKTAKLKEILKLISENFTKSEFLEFAKALTTQVLAIEKKLIEKNGKDTQELKAELDKLIKSTQETLNKLFEEQTQNLNFIRDKVRGIKNGKDGRDGKNGQDGKDADSKQIIKEVLKLIPKQIIETPEQERDKLESLEGNERLKISAIDELQEILDELKKRPAGKFGGGGFSKMAMDLHFVDDETPTGTVNGTNKDFVLAHAPNPTASLKVFVNGQKMKLTDDYTLSGQTISFVTVPPTTSLILCDYRI